MNRSKPSTLRVTLICVVVTALAFCVWLFLPQSWVLSSNDDVDVNSGDLRDGLSVFGVPLTSRVQESELSREVRRLGMAMPAEREWKHMGRHFGGVYRDSSYGFMMGPCETLVVILEETNTLDEERRAILEKLMKMLRTEEPGHVREEAFLLTIEIADKHNLHVLNPSVEDYYRALLKDRQKRME
jgi:hypothetical protein